MANTLTASCLDHEPYQKAVHACTFLMQEPFCPLGSLCHCYLWAKHYHYQLWQACCSAAVPRRLTACLTHYCTPPLLPHPLPIQLLCASLSHLGRRADWLSGNFTFAGRATTQARIVASCKRARCRAARRACLHRGSGQRHWLRHTEARTRGRRVTPPQLAASVNQDHLPTEPPANLYLNT